MQHNAAVANCPTCPARSLLTDKPVFHTYSVIRKLLAKENMPILAAEGFVLVVRDNHFPILHAKRVAVIVVQVEPSDFDIPAIEIFTVEQRNPAFGVGDEVGQLACCCRFSFSETSATYSSAGSTVDFTPVSPALVLPEPAETVGWHPQSRERQSENKHNFEIV